MGRSVNARPLFIESPAGTNSCQDNRHGDTAKEGEGENGNDEENGKGGENEKDEESSKDEEINGQ